MTARIIPPDILPPWDLMRYFSLPTLEETLLSVTNGTLILPANLRRWAMFVGFPFTGGATSVGCSISPTNQGANNIGIAVTSSQPILWTQPIQGALIQSEWWAYSNPAVTVVTITIDAIDWPYDDKVNQLDSIDRGPRRPPVKIDAAPGVGGRRGLLDYWRSLVAKFGGGNGRH